MLRALSQRTSRPRGFADWRALSEAWLRLLTIDLCLRVLPFRWVERRLTGPLRSTEQTGGTDSEVVSRCVWAAGAAARHHLWPMHCLPRSLTLARMLRHRGFVAELRIGVAREPGRLLAHAWVEIEGRPLGDAEGWTGRFHPLSSAETPAATENS